MVERSLSMREVRGSIPCISSLFLKSLKDSFEIFLDIDKIKAYFEEKGSKTSESITQNKAGFSSSENCQVDQKQLKTVVKSVSQESSDSTKTYITTDSTDFQSRTDPCSYSQS